jgi:hypothetical protein
MSDMTAVTSGAGTTYPSRVPGFSPGLSEFRGFQFEDMFALFHLANVLLLYLQPFSSEFFFDVKSTRETGLRMSNMVFYVFVEIGSAPKI